MRCLPLVLLAAPLWAPGTARGDDSASAEVCTAAAGCAAPGSQAGASNDSYLWGRPRGPMPMTGGNSPHKFGGWPCDMQKKLAWSWTPPLGKYSNTGVQAPVVDSDGDLYVAAEESIRRFSPDGLVRWTFELPPPWKENIMGPWIRRMPSLIEGLLVETMTSGFAFALDMKTGSLVWNVSITETGCLGMDYGFVVAGEGVVLGDAECSEPSQQKMNKVFALNATDGSHLWDFRPEVGVWNFLPYLIGDGTVIFQTWDGGVYRLRLKDGSVVWHARGGGKENSWTDGGPALGPNGIFYVVRSSGGQNLADQGMPGFLSAYNVTDGQLLWSNPLEQSPYTYPVVGRLREGGPLMVVTGVGSLGSVPLAVSVVIWAALGMALGLCVGCFWGCRSCRRDRKRGRCEKTCGCCCRLFAAAWLVAIGAVLIGNIGRKRDFPHSVQAFDAETGQLHWRYDMPTYRWYSAAGDESGLFTRLLHGHVPVCLPLASSYPTLDAQGIFYMGHMDGKLYAIQDRNGDGHIDEGSEVCSFDTGGSFSTQGPTLVPGMMAVGTCDSLFVFKS